MATSASYYTTCSHTCPINTKPGTIVDASLKNVNSVCNNSNVPTVSVPAEIMKLRAARGLHSVVDCRFLSSVAAPKYRPKGSGTRDSNSSD